MSLHPTFAAIAPFAPAAATASASERHLLDLLARTRSLLGLVTQAQIEQAGADLDAALALFDEVTKTLRAHGRVA